jgi:uncharacterized protein (DUF169 family)
VSLDADDGAPGAQYISRKEETEMEWQSWGKRLTEVLELKKSPVAVSYADSAPTGASAHKCRACGALREAAAGAVIDLTAENSACPGGSQYLGLRAQAPEHARALREFLIHGEKLFSSPAAIHRSMALAKVKPPLGLADHVLFSPLARAQLRPDVTVFICDAWQAARLINLAYFENGMPMECDPTGSLCRSVIAYPLITGKVNVSLGDVTARKMEKFAQDELFVSLPFSDLRSAAASIDRCTAGTAKGEIPAAMRRVMKESGGEPPEI